MSDSQFYCVVIYTYDYWQNQPGTTWVHKYHIVELQKQTVTYERNHFAWQNNFFYRL